MAEEVSYVIFVFAIQILAFCLVLFAQPRLCQWVSYIIWLILFIGGSSSLFPRFLINL